MKNTRRILDVGQLPDTVFGPRSILWWGTLGYLVIEAVMLGVCAVAFLYVRKNFEAYPPLGTPYPNLLFPTIALVALLASVPAQRYVDRAARKFDQRKVRNGLLVSVLLGGAALIARGLALTSLGTRWDSDAYGSALWFIIGAHTFIFLLEVIESTIGVVLFSGDRVEPKHYSDAVDSALYWCLVVALWVPLFALIYLAPFVL